MSEVPKKRAVAYRISAQPPRIMAVRRVNPVNCTAYISIMAELQLWSYRHLNDGTTKHSLIDEIEMPVCVCSHAAQL